MVSSRGFSGDTLVLATHNRGKVEEFRILIGDRVPRVLSAGEVDLPEPEETGASFLENATIKALSGARHCGLPCLADDSGLCVNALGGNPGIYSARWAGPRKDFTCAMRLVHQRMAESGDSDTRAVFVAALVLAWPDGHTESVEGRIDGRIIHPGRGEGGHGYDPIFVPEGEVRSFAEMTMAEKNTYSHRARALAALIAKVFPGDD